LSSSSSISTADYAKVRLTILTAIHSDPCLIHSRSCPSLQSAFNRGEIQTGLEMLRTGQLPKACDAFAVSKSLLEFIEFLHQLVIA
jgi:hypothetical protein